MRSSGYDSYISIEHPVAQTEDKFGSSQPTDWVRLLSCRARRQDMRPTRTDAEVLGAIVGRNQTTFWMRWRGDITGNMRVVLHGDVDVVYQIVGGPAEVGGRRRELEIVCEKYTS